MSARRVATLFAAMAVAVTGPTSSALADSASGAVVKAVVVDHGTVRIVLGDSAGGAPLDPADVHVSVGGTPWATTAQVSHERAVTSLRTAIIAMDVSGSMAPRLAAARSAAMHYLQVVPADVRVGLVAFSDRARIVVAPTTDRPAVAVALAGLRARGQTSLYDGIGLALSALGGGGERQLVLLSDGLDNRSEATLAGTGTALATAGASVDLVSFGSDGGQQPTLALLAARARGRLTQADTGAQLTDAFARTARRFVDEVTVTAQVPAGSAGGPVELTIRVGHGSGLTMTAVPVTLPAVHAAGTVDATSPDVAAPARAAGAWQRPAVLVTAFLALFLLFAVGLTPTLWKESSSSRRTREITRYRVSGLGAAPPIKAAPAAVTEAALAWAGRTVQRRGVEDSWRMELDRAAVPLRPQEWLLIRVSISVLAAAAAVVALPLWWLTAPLAALAGWLMAGAVIRFKARRRLKRFAENLPDVLQLIAGSLRSGFSLPQAVDNTAKDGEQPMAGELSRALAESRLGVDLEDALDRVAERMRSTDLTWTVMAVRIAREVGGNLAEVLLSTAETMRERSRIQRQVKVLSAEGRLSAYVLIGLPVGITLFMVAFRGSYIAPLVNDPIGWVMTTYGVVSVLVGTWWMSRMIKLEV